MFGGLGGRTRVPGAIHCSSDNSSARACREASIAAAAAAGADYYQTCLVNGIDPAVALAFFGQAPNYGTQPGAAANQTWANMRAPAPAQPAASAT